LGSPIVEHVFELTVLLYSFSVNFAAKFFEIKECI